MPFAVSFFIGLLLVFPLWRIFTNTGMNPAFSLFIFVPFFGLLITAAILAFANWPAIPHEPRN